MEKKTYVVRVIHKYVIEAETEEEAEKIAWESSYGEAVDCYTEVEER